jgi:hypothetical protein
MGKKRVLVGYGLDVDAVANHINTTKGGLPNLTNVSRGRIIVYSHESWQSNRTQASLGPLEA